MVSASAKMWICTDHQVDGYISMKLLQKLYFDQILKIVRSESLLWTIELSNSESIISSMFCI